MSKEARCTPPDIIKVIKLKTVKWDKRVTGKILERSSCKVEVLKPELKELFERNLQNGSLHIRMLLCGLISLAYDKVD